MSVAGHLGIDVAEYDARIRTFIPDYEAMLDAGAAVVPRSARTIVDLGTGTGAFAERCLARAVHARIIGIDADAGILRLAARRLGGRASFIRGNFVRTALPRGDVAIASFSLHHVRTVGAKLRLYTRIHAALQPRGTLITVDCQPSPDRAKSRADMDGWLAHLRRTYSPRKAAGFLDAWADEDVYVPLPAEIRLLERAGFRVNVVWRRGAFAVLRARVGGHGRGLGLEA